MQTAAALAFHTFMYVLAFNVTLIIHLYCNVAFNKFYVIKYSLVDN